MGVHNLSNKDNVLILYKVDNSYIIEQYLKALLKKQIYNRKEHYRI
jgi:hypothetical protein